MPAVNVFQFKMLAGFAGSVSRVESATIEPNLIDDGTPPTIFGAPEPEPLSSIYDEIERRGLGNA